MKSKKFNKPQKDSSQHSSKWLELANLISRKNRDFSIIRDIEKDPTLKRIHNQRDKIFFSSFHL